MLQVLGLLSTLLLRNPEAAAAAADAGCLEAVLEVMAADEAPAADDPRNAAQWAQRQVPSPWHGFLAAPACMRLC